MCHNRKHEQQNYKVMFVFYFQKLVFENIKKKQFSYIFEIKNMFGQLKLKKKNSLLKKKNRKY